MADAVIEKIQPCLLDRLTDEAPESQKESRNERIISIRRYREGVLRDLVWLLNGKAHTAEEDLNEFPEVARSVLNFGTRDLCGLISANMDMRDLEHDISEAICLFEPRINPSTLEVRAVAGAKRDSNGLSIEIRGELWAHPIPEQLYVRSEIDLDTGEYTV
ncbi:MAG TPA: type VI secretion system baseplate subunit TssE [Terrimicrobiaceae bacterium]|nr:type VI secretion system baseplate subunit TssE [Terrimicrobiaceae bacterium]